MFNFKKGLSAISYLIFWMFFNVAVVIVVIIILQIANLSVEMASRIPPNLEDELILASRFYNSEKCFAYEDDVGRVYTRVIDLNKFKQEDIESEQDRQQIKYNCFPESDVKYSFSLTLSEVPTSINPGPLPAIGTIKTFNWGEIGFAAKAVDEDILIFSDDNQLTQGSLRIEIKNVE